MGTVGSDLVFAEMLGEGSEGDFWSCLGFALEDRWFKQQQFCGHRKGISRVDLHMAPALSSSCRERQSPRGGDSVLASSSLVPVVP